MRALLVVVATLILVGLAWRSSVRGAPPVPVLERELGPAPAPAPQRLHTEEPSVTPVPAEVRTDAGAQAPESSDPPVSEAVGSADTSAERPIVSAGTIEGRVLLAGGLPAADARIRARPAAEWRPDPVTGKPRRAGPHQTSSDLDGRYELRDVPAGEWRVAAAELGSPLWVGSDPVRVTAGGRAFVPDMTLRPVPPDQTLRGRVVGPDGRPADDALVRYGNLDGNGTGSMHTDRDGRFKIHGTPGARYRVEASRQPYGPASREARVGEDVEITLERVPILAVRVLPRSPIQSFRWRLGIRGAADDADWRLHGESEELAFETAWPTGTDVLEILARSQPGHRVELPTRPAVGERAVVEVSLPESD